MMTKPLTAFMLIVLGLSAAFYLLAGWPGVAIGWLLVITFAATMYPTIARPDADDAIDAAPPECRCDLPTRISFENMRSADNAERVMDRATFVSVPIIGECG